MSTDRAEGRWRRRVAGASGLLVTGLGIFALLGWILNVPAWPSLWSETIPMAPSTALLFMVLGTAACLRAWLPQADTSLRWAVPVGVLVTLIGLALAVMASMGTFLEVEHLGITILMDPGQYPLGHMSPLTAILFVAGGLSFVASLRWPGARRRPPQASWWLACLLMAVGLILILAYLIGVEQLHSIPGFPPAALTSASFLLLGTALLCLADLRTQQVAPRSEGREFSFGLLLLIFGLLAVGIITIGTLSYRTYEDNYRNEVDRQLLAVWQLKVEELEDWRRERIGDAQVLYGNSAFSALVERFLGQPQNEESRRQLMEWLGRYPVAYEYARVFLLDARGVERLSVPETGETLASHMIQEAAAALRSGEIAFLDFHRDEPSGQVYLDLLVPVVDAQEGSRPIGTLVLRIDPQAYLYPFIARWPTTSRTAETQLVRREGEEVVILNELRFRRGTALNLRFPLTQLDLPAAAAARGEAGFMEGIDYRGVPVIAHLGPVPDSPWSLVARMDTAEIYAPLRGRLWQTIAFFGLLVAASGAGLGVFWRQQRLSNYRSRHQAAEALRTSEEKLRKALLITPDAVAITRLSDGRFVSVNEGFTRFLGYAETEVVGKSSLELEIWESPEDRKEIVARLETHGMVENFEAAFRTKTGELRQGLMSAVIIELDGEAHIMNTTRDITGRKRAEKELQVLSLRNEAILAAVPDIIMEVDRNQVYTWANRAGLEFFGEGVIGKEAGFYFEGEQDSDALVQPPFDGKEEVFYVESWQRRQDGEKRLLGWWCRMLKDAEGNVTGALSTARDITEREATDVALQKTLAELGRSNLELEQFAYVASHDLQEPLRMVSSYTQLLARRYSDKLDQDARDFIAYAVDGANRMQRLIQDLLTYSRVATHGHPYEPVNLNDALGEAVANLQAAIHESAAQVSHGDLPTVDGDRTQLVQVFQNLIDNAIKFRKTEEPPRIHVSARRQGTEWIIAVKDNGIGIDPQYFRRLFVVFQRLHGPQEYPGTGIGLALCRRIITRHGGRIWVESAPGQGSEFFFTLTPDPPSSPATGAET